MRPRIPMSARLPVARDITTLRRTEEALHAAQATRQAKLVAIRDANRKLTREIAARRKADSDMRSNNQALEATVRQLESIHRDGADLSHMAELLQACTQRAEAYAIVRETGAQLFPDSYGSLFIYRESRDVLEHVTSWDSGQAQEKTLVPDECWALRLGNPHFAPRKGTVRCRHAHDETESYVCMPIHGQGQVLGLFHIAIEVDPRSRRPARDADQRLRAMTDRVGPALANLKLRDSLREMALRDGLTGLYNRRYLEDVFSRELHRAERSGKPVSVVMIDIDHFKRFNDKHGHDAGDFVLSAVARAISNNIRPSDVACRYGGEEFAVVLPETTGLRPRSRRANPACDTSDEDFAVFGAVASETDDYPIGAARMRWSPSALAREDAKIAEYEVAVSEQVLEACRNVLARFTSAGSSGPDA